MLLETLLEEIFHKYKKVYLPWIDTYLSLNIKNNFAVSLPEVNLHCDTLNPDKKRQAQFSLSGARLRESSRPPPCDETF